LWHTAVNSVRSKPLRAAMKVLNSIRELRVEPAESSSSNADSVDAVVCRERADLSELDYSGLKSLGFLTLIGHLVKYHMCNQMF